MSSSALASRPTALSGDRSTKRAERSLTMEEAAMRAGRLISEIVRAREMCVRNE